MWTGLSPPPPPCCLASEESLPSFSHTSSSAEAPMGLRRSAGAIFVSATESSLVSLSEALLTVPTPSSAETGDDVDNASFVCGRLCALVPLMWTGFTSYQASCLSVCGKSARCCCPCWVNCPSSPPAWLLVALCWNFPPGSTRVVNPRRASSAWRDPNCTRKRFKSALLARRSLLPLARTWGGRLLTWGSVWWSLRTRHQSSSAQLTAPWSWVVFSSPCCLWCSWGSLWSLCINTNQ